MKDSVEKKQKFMTGKSHQAGNSASRIIKATRYARTVFQIEAYLKVG